MRRPARQLAIHIFMLVTSFFSTTIPANSVLCIGAEGHSRIELPHAGCCTESPQENLYTLVEYDDETVTDCGACVDFYLRFDATTRTVSTKVDVSHYAYSVVPPFNDSLRFHSQLFDANQQQFGTIPKHIHLSILSTIVIRC